ILGRRLLAAFEASQDGVLAAASGYLDAGELLAELGIADPRRRHNEDLRVDASALPHVGNDFRSPLHPRGVPGFGGHPPPGPLHEHAVRALAPAGVLEDRGGAAYVVGIALLPSVLYR